jgi:lipoprotein NlpI
VTQTKAGIRSGSLWQSAIVAPGYGLLALYLTACSQQPALQATAKAIAGAEPISAAVLLTEVQQQQFDLAKQQLGAGDAMAARQLLAPLRQELPGAAGIGYNLAVSQWQSGDVAGAEQTLTQVVSVAAHYSDAHNLLGVLARQQGNFNQAERHFQRALQMQADYAMAHKNLAFLYELYLGRPLQAHYHYKQYFALTADEQTKVWLALLEQQLTQEQNND